MSNSIDMIRQLVRFPTTPDQPNRPLIDFAANYLSDLGAEIRLFPDEDGGKANLFATFGPADVPGWVFSGHTDVVPADATAWHHPPFVATLVDDRLYGRGTTDMKGFVGITLAAVSQLRADDLRQPIHIALSYDEEIGCVGVRSMTDALAGASVKPKACIVGEPTEMMPVLGHKGKASWRCTIHGRAAHSSVPHQGVNANALAARLLSGLVDLAEDPTAMGHEDRYDPPRSTLVIGPIAGGKQLNVLADHCTFEFECRHLAPIDPDRLLKPIIDLAAALESEARRTAPEATITIEKINDYPGFDIPENAAIVRAIDKIAKDPSHHWVGFGTEAGLFAQAGIPTVVCGPGSIQQAHIVDEFLMLNQIDACETFLLRLFDSISAGA